VSGLDVSDLQVDLNGKKYILNQKHTRWGKTAMTLEWDWVAATDSSSKVTDGSALKFALHQFNDHAGNAAAPLSWEWKVDFAQDKTPPQPPAITRLPANIHLFDTFTENAGSWRNWNAQNGSLVSRYFDPDRQDYCLKVVDEMTNGTGGVYISTKAFDAKEFTHISFDYKIPASTKIHIMFVVNGAWKGITLTAPLTYSSYKNIGNAYITADNKWHSVVVPLRKILEAVLPDAKKYKITNFAISDYYGSYTPANVPYFIDNFCITGPAKGDMSFSCKSFDSSGISGFTSSISLLENTESKPVEHAGAEVSVPARIPGQYFLNLAAKDGAGNLSRPARAYYEVPWTLNSTKKLVKGALLFRAWHGAQDLMDVIKSPESKTAPDSFSVWSQPITLSQKLADWNFLPAFIPAWKPAAKTPQNACFRWDGSITFSKAGNWHLLVSSGLPITLGLESGEPAKITEFSSPDKTAAGKVLKLTTVNALKAGHAVAFWLQAYSGTGKFTGLNFWWSQDKAWEAVKAGAVENGKLPKEAVPASAFSYQP
jgi:hypothetical protein